MFLNKSHLPATFLLTGMPGLESLYRWISFPFCFMFFMSIVGNSLILLVIIKDYKLHQPMFFFLTMLAITDLLFTLVTSPSVLGIFLFDYKVIRSQLCLLQMFFIHSLSITESSLLVAMAFDRYVAICHPLRYTSTLTSSAVAKAGLVSALRGTLIHIPPVSSLQFLPYCNGNALSHSYCLHQDVMELACHGTNTFNIMYGLAIILCTVTLDLILIVLSYILILRAVFHVTKMDRYKLFNTCVSHLCAVFLFYVPIVALSIVHRFGKQVSPLFMNIMANAYLFLPSVLNPIIYSIKSKQIREVLLQMFHGRPRDC
ncbi:PREDICTED: olfactory receptor 51G2-like [Nanorana parkeri]|uniref:olfactory receptor 51G2-like n=1 Tax=Nanorana parkeri TaxID=125878 RepID=UPI000854BF7F|nr:PREDICTED: olfactory receptor 51G2-like [Nanorana parkeri]